MTDLPKPQFPVQHGTPAAYRYCRCEYCTAASRVAQRHRTKDEKAPLLAEVRAAALSGAPIPEAALPMKNRPHKGITSIRKMSEGEKSKTSAEVIAATQDALHARLRAVEHADGDVAKLALLSVAEFTEDPIREMRYRRVVDAL